MQRNRSMIFLAVLALAAVATSAAQAEPRTQSGKPAACKAPTGEYFGLGETIELHQTDANGNIVKVTYQCTDNGWVKVAKAGLHGAGSIKISPGGLQRAP
jgi:hypothetical protein